MKNFIKGIFGYGDEKKNNFELFDNYKGETKLYRISNN